VVIFAALAHLAPELLAVARGIEQLAKVQTMCEIIDFQSMRRAHLRLRATKCAENVGRYTAQVEWLKRSGAPLADLVRASLGADKAAHDCRKIGQNLTGHVPETLHS
jgi:hypothetical protein